MPAPVTVRALALALLVILLVVVIAAAASPRRDGYSTGFEVETDQRATGCAPCEGMRVFPQRPKVAGFPSGSPEPHLCGRGPEQRRVQYGGARGWTYSPYY